MLRNIPKDSLSIICKNRADGRKFVKGKKLNCPRENKLKYLIVLFVKQEWGID